MKKSSFLGLIALFFLALIAAASGVYLFCSSDGCSSSLIKGCVLIIISIAFFCLIYSLFESIKGIELAELKKEEKRIDFENKKDWEQFVFDLNKEKKSLEMLQKDKKELEYAKGKIEKELQELKEQNKDFLLARDEQIKQMYIYALLGQEKSVSADEIKKKLDEAKESYEKIKEYIEHI